MTQPALGLDSREILDCLECLIPAAVATSSQDDTPNVTWLSLVHRIDPEHVGLSRQFFRKTADNIQGNRRLQLLVLHPNTGRQYQLNLQHVRTETDGPRYDSMRTQLEAVASQSGMSKVFRLRALDVCRVLSIESVPTEQVPPEPVSIQQRPGQEGLSSFSEAINAAIDVDDLITRSLSELETCFGYRHSILLLLDQTGERLYTVASHGYPVSGVGSEVRTGEGHIGVAAERRQTVLAANMAKDAAYTEAVRQSATRAGQSEDLSREIPLPGLPNVMSQLSIPVTARGQLLGVLTLQSDEPGFFRSSDEDIAAVIATELGLAMALLQLAPVVDSSPWRISKPPAESPTAEIKHYASDDSIFIDNEYLIKGVAGRILWRILSEYTTTRRVDFSNKEIRLDQTLEMPDINDNLEARLILLRRRLQDQCAFMHIVKTHRGRFRLNVDRPITLKDVP